MKKTKNKKKEKKIQTLFSLSFSFLSFLSFLSFFFSFSPSRLTLFLSQNGSLLPPFPLTSSQQEANPCAILLGGFYSHVVSEKGRNVGKHGCATATVCWCKGWPCWSLHLVGSTSCVTLASSWFGMAEVAGRTVGGLDSRPVGEDDGSVLCAA